MLGQSVTVPASLEDHRAGPGVSAGTGAGSGDGGVPPPTPRCVGSMSDPCPVSHSGPVSDSPGGSAVTRRPDQRTHGLLPSTLGSPARLHGVVARASGCRRHVVAI